MITPEDFEKWYHHTWLMLNPGGIHFVGERLDETHWSFSSLTSGLSTPWQITNLKFEELHPETGLYNIKDPSPGVVFVYKTGARQWRKSYGQGMYRFFDPLSLQKQQLAKSILEKYSMPRTAILNDYLGLSSSIDIFKIKTQVRYIMDPWWPDLKTAIEKINGGVFGQYALNHDLQVLVGYNGDTHNLYYLDFPIGEISLNGDRVKIKEKLFLQEVEDYKKRTNQSFDIVR